MQSMEEKYRASAQRRTRVLIYGLLGLGAWGVWSFRSTMAPPREAEWKQVQRLRAEAQAEAMDSISNHVVGITRIVRLDLDTFAPLPGQWKGQATVERVNRVGGIERVELSLGPVHTTMRDDRIEVLHVSVR
jgi:hypothetical protein